MSQTESNARAAFSLSLHTYVPRPASLPLFLTRDTLGPAYSSSSVPASRKSTPTLGLSPSWVVPAVPLSHPAPLASWTASLSVTSWSISAAEGSTSAGSGWKEGGMESPGPLEAIKLVVTHRLVTATYLPNARMYRSGNIDI